MKKLKTLLAVFGCAFLFPFAFSVTASAISSTHWAIDVADLTLNQGIIEGSRSTFYPDANFTRGQFAYAGQNRRRTDQRYSRNGIQRRPVKS